MTILIITKEYKTRLRLSYFLQRMDLHEAIECFETAELAMSALPDVKRKRLKLILYDELCTERNKEDFFGRTSVLHKWSKVPILLVTTHMKHEYVLRAFYAGIFDFVLKPIEFTYFLSRVHIALKFYEESSQRQSQEDMLKKDLQIAKNVQQSALTPSLHQEHIQLDGFYVTSNTLGGDMYCWFQVSPHQTAVILYDVMGHGVAASLMTMSIRSLLKGMMTRLVDPVRVMQELNAHIHELLKDDIVEQYLVTAIYLLVDTKEQKISYVNAGLPAGVLISEDGQVQRLAANTLILGFLREMKIEKQEIYYTGQQRMILYTDGLQQGNEPLEGTHFNDYVAGSNDADLNQYVLDQRLHETTHKDDITIVFMTIA